MSAVQRRLNAIGQSIKQSTVWLLDGTKRFFSPSDDDYPKTGVQPFEGRYPETSQQ